jgi:hypothetical protein
VYLTAVPALKRAAVDRDVQRLLRRLHGDKAVYELKGWGQSDHAVSSTQIRGARS